MTDIFDFSSESEYQHITTAFTSCSSFYMAPCWIQPGNLLISGLSALYCTVLHKMPMYSKLHSVQKFPGT